MGNQFELGPLVMAFFIPNGPAPPPPPPGAIDAPYVEPEELRLGAGARLGFVAQIGGGWALAPALRLKFGNDNHGLVGGGDLDVRRYFGGGDVVSPYALAGLSVLGGITSRGDLIVLPDLVLQAGAGLNVRIGRNSFIGAAARAGYAIADTYYGPFEGAALLTFELP